MSQQEPLNQNHALSILIRACEVAQKRGAFNLDEAALLSQAVKLFVPDPPPEEEVVENDDSSSDETE